MQRQRAQIVAAEREDIEGVELHLVIVLAGVQRVEVGDAVDAEDHGLAVDDEMLLAVLERGLGDPGIAARPVGAVARQQPHALVLPDDKHPIAVVLDFVEPVRSGRNLLAGGRQA